MVVGPGFFKAMRQQFDGLRAIGVPDQKTDCGGTEPTHHPKNIFHLELLLFSADFYPASTMQRDENWMRLILPFARLDLCISQARP
jgi:hypothetical protein